LTSGQPGDTAASSVLRTEAFHFAIAPIAACTRVRSLSIYHPEIADDAAVPRRTVPAGPDLLTGDAKHAIIQLRYYAVGMQDSERACGSCTG